MKGIIDKLFNSKTQEGAGDGVEALDFVSQILEQFIIKSDLNLSFDLEQREDDRIFANFSGEDSDILTNKSGAALNALTTIIICSLFKKNFTKKVRVDLDVNGFREESDSKLLKLADKIKNNVLNNGRPAFFKPLPPRERKLIHEFLSDKGDVKTISIGEGFLKKVKVFIPSGEASENM